MDTPDAFVSRPVRVRAIQWTGDNLRAVQQFVWPASPFYAPPAGVDHPPKLRVRVRDEVAEEKYPALGPQWKEIDVPDAAWVVQRVDEHEVLVVTARRFAATYTQTQEIDHEYKKDAWRV